jgi:hypothetical protein
MKVAARKTTIQMIQISLAFPINLLLFNLALQGLFLLIMLPLL